ncbi:MAG TPA: glycosyltransferase family 4 protein [Roseiflexaceae bacterium]|nr:glycosyltransferase family 4 protein [Roseiflexaceae bacterium]
MHIAQVAPMYEAVPPHRYGGTERVVSYLTEELVRRGHTVTLFASGDSRTSARLSPTTNRALRERFTLKEMQNQAFPLHLAMLGEVMQRAHEFDVIHNHVDYLSWPFAPFVDTPMLTTMHGRLDLDYLPSVLQRYPNTSLVSISHHQRMPLAPSRPNWVGTVYNAIPVADFPFSDTPGDYLLYLGRITPEKRPDWAVEIAIRTGIPLVVAAKVDPYDQEYYEREIKHLFEHPLVTYVGEVDEHEKRQLLVNAYALVFPIDWPEPFGMVMIESLACGTPVLAMNCGSVPEILSHGINSLVGGSVSELVAMAPMLGMLNRHACRREAEDRFDSSVMASNYEQVYQRVISDHLSRQSVLELGGVPAQLVAPRLDERLER